MFVSVCFCLRLCVKTGDILNNFSYDNMIANIARGLLAFSIVFTYPMQMFSCRRSLIEILIKVGGNINITYIENNSNYNKMHYLMTFLIWFLTMLCSLLIHNLGAFQELIGCMTSSAITFIFPCFLFFKIHGGWLQIKKNAYYAYKNENIKKKQKLNLNCKQRFHKICHDFIIPIFILFFGFIVLIIGSITVFLPN